MQIIVTSYCRLKYLKATLESLRQDPVKLYVVDGGSDAETRDLIRSMADGWMFLEGNPGADHLKTEGIKRFVTDPEFVISSDDLVYPAGYSELILSQYRKLNPGGKIRWTFTACNLDYIEEYYAKEFVPINGVLVREVGNSQVAGAIVDTEICRSVGYFPVYGTSGQGDFAFSSRLRQRGLRLGYFRYPLLNHIGKHKAVDYPEYSKAFSEDQDRWYPAAIEDKGQA